MRTLVNFFKVCVKVIINHAASWQKRRSQGNNKHLMKRTKLILFKKILMWKTD